MTRGWRHGSPALVADAGLLEPLDFLARLAALVPPPAIVAGGLAALMMGLIFLDRGMAPGRN